MRLPRHWTPASGHSAWRGPQRSSKKEAKQCGAQGAALPHPNLDCATGSRATADLHAHGSTSVQQLYGCQHLAMQHELVAMASRLTFVRATSMADGKQLEGT